MTIEDKKFKTIKVEREDGITWLYFNRPEKRNAMNPTLHREMWDALVELEQDPETKVLVLTGAGDKSWCAGQDIRETFRDRIRERENNPGARREPGGPRYDWSWGLLSTFAAPTIAMVNGYCFGGAFPALIACDFAIAAEDAIFGLSEVNWGILPGGVIPRVVRDVMRYRDALYYVMTGDPFDGKKAAEMGLVNRAVPREILREETVKLARHLMEKNPHVLLGAKEAFKVSQDMNYAQARAYVGVRERAMIATDPEKGREKGMSQFLDEKSFRPGFGAYRRE
ncbi:MAG: p-hydroxycinnamoyl CoA hydratase/lyase [Chloroflexi bacterium]|nr:p-hydroxycinnamoyl CoA hydratase/lyase [Chloroflexota bacterium]